jgi:hypothetical protein
VPAGSPRSCGFIVRRGAVSRHVAQEGVNDPEQEADKGQEEEFPFVLGMKEHVRLRDRDG